MADKIESNGWNEWKNYVLSELERINVNIEKGHKERDEFNESFTSSLNDVKLAIERLKMKSGIWGGIAGFIPVVLILLLYYIRNLS